ncbi:hypothetical protein HMPREF3213_03557 [Heyndrickxia coagulans]|uniref:Uncharacterized protein n=1 Tax=Heyndrickxia coagulans TaxID=1398 RepID=A0A133KBY1_HEYCO|nr:hypothetical protein HMPREF3213_03557 [Heyndrickxia coagulans]
MCRSKTQEGSQKGKEGCLQRPSVEVPESTTRNRYRVGKTVQ